MEQFDLNIKTIKVKGVLCLLFIFVSVFFLWIDLDDMNMRIIVMERFDLKLRMFYSFFFFLFCFVNNIMRIMIMREWFFLSRRLGLKIFCLFFLFLWIELDGNMKVIDNIKLYIYIFFLSIYIENKWYNLSN